MKRGEPRGPSGKADAGDCVDCYRCVMVCPTGIDIRNGTQLECVGCANCVDACDEMMAKLGRNAGLVRYDSLRGFESTRRSLFRPRFYVYLVLGMIGATVMLTAVTRRSIFEANLLRPGGMPYTIEETVIRNLITLHLQNKSAEPRTYFLTPVVPEAAQALEPSFIVPEPRVHLAGMADARVPLFVTVSRDRYKEPFKMSVAVRDSLTGKERLVSVNFLGP